MNAGPGGFRGAPISKCFLLGTVGTSVIIQASKSARRRPLIINLFTHAFVFRNPGELLFGASLLYFCRLFERQWGSSKYGSFVMATSILAYSLEAVAGPLLGLRPASGPFPLIFANLIANFVLLVPPMNSFTIFGIKMTGKAFIYLASIQLLLSAAPASVVAGGCGLVAGLLYRLNVLGLQRLRLPASVVDLFSSTIGRMLMGPSQTQVFVAPTASQLAAQQQQGGGPAMGAGLQQFGGNQGQAMQRGGGAAAPAPTIVASPETLQQLVAMGFEEDSAAQALRQTGNNVEAAVQVLFS